MAIMFLGFPEYILAFNSIGHKSTNTWGSVDLKFSRSRNVICLKNSAYTGKYKLVKVYHYAHLQKYNGSIGSI